MAYNVAEGAVAVSAGVVASSAALIGFGLDSVVEVASGLVILWQFRHAVPESRERVALRLMAVSFFALAAYVTGDAVRALTGAGAAEPSRVGIVLAAVSLAGDARTVLGGAAPDRPGARVQHGGGRLHPDAAVHVPVRRPAGGLGLNAAFGWSWADPVAGLVIAAVAIREGVEAWRGDTCCTPLPPLPGPVDAASTPGGCSDGCC